MPRPEAQRMKLELPALALARQLYATLVERGLGAPVPAWLVVFGTGIGLALGYCAALLAR